MCKGSRKEVKFYFYFLWETTKNIYTNCTLFPPQHIGSSLTTLPDRQVETVHCWVYSNHSTNPASLSGSYGSPRLINFLLHHICALKCISIHQEITALLVKSYECSLPLRCCWDAL